MIYDSIYMYLLAQANAQRQKVDQQLSETGGREEWGETATGHEVSFQGNENVLQLDCGDDCPTL